MGANMGSNTHAARIMLERIKQTRFMVSRLFVGYFPVCLKSRSPLSAINPHARIATPIGKAINGPG
jgi:hypothetical protein